MMQEGTQVYHGDEMLRSLLQLGHSISTRSMN